MTCGLHGKLDAAITAVKEALTASLEADVSDKDLDNLLCAYKGLKSVAKNNVTGDTGITFVPDTTLGDSLTFNDDIHIDTSDLTSAGTVTFGSDYVAGLGSDVITFPDDIDKDA
tara:strand:+ start:381 stop:722 length:342 start_codon:yes stop_codon:yes gene_type:complete